MIFTIIYNRPNQNQYTMRLDDEQLAKDTISNLKYIGCSVLFFPDWDEEGKFIGHVG